MADEPDQPTDGSRFAVQSGHEVVPLKFRRTVNLLTDEERRDNEAHDRALRDAAEQDAVRGSDEAYVIDLCDQVLQQVASRQHRFEFLRGDRGTRGSAYLPVDAFYEALDLVVEFHEKQHSEAVPHFDKPDKLTVSGMPRSEQRKRYDQRRREVLPQKGITVVELRYDQFSHGKDRRLTRAPADDLAVIRRALAAHVAGVGGTGADALPTPFHEP